MMWIFYVLCGFLSGIVGGMGMGGGTLLIPLLTLFLGVGQHTAQGINLVVFIPMGIVAVVIHMINKLVDYKAFLFLVVPAIISSVFASNISNNLDNSTSKFIFGAFLIILSVVLLVFAIKSSKKQKKPVIKNKL